MKILPELCIGDRAWMTWAEIGGTPPYSQMDRSGQFPWRSVAVPWSLPLHSPQTGARCSPAIYPGSSVWSFPHQICTPHLSAMIDTRLFDNNKCVNVYTRESVPNHKFWDSYKKVSKAVKDVWIFRNLINILFTTLTYRCTVGYLVNKSLFLSVLNGPWALTEVRWADSDVYHSLHGLSKRVPVIDQ